MTIRGRGRGRALALAFTAVLAAGVVASPPARSDPTPPVQIGTAWGSGTLTEAELGELILKMTLDEKDTFLHGTGDWCSPTGIPCQSWGEAGRIPGVARLGIPPLRLTDGPAGVRLGHVETALPAPVGLAASFDRNAAALFGKTFGLGARASNQDVWLGPMMNMVNYVTGGRNFETLGEDPYMAGELTVPLVKGVQGEGVLAQIKHYITNDFENGRNSTSVKIDEQTLHENSLVPFEAGIKAGAASVMCSYNRINDIYGCGNDYTLNQVLRRELGFKGFVTSDWGATHRTTDIINGLDMEQPGSGNLGNALIQAATNGTAAVPMTNDYPAFPAYSAGVWLAAIDASVLRILRQMNNAGLLEGTQYGSRYTDGTPWVPPRPDLASLREDEFETAQSLAEESATLLKNDGKALPLTSSDLTQGGGVVVMGPTAVTPYIGGGGSAHVIPYPTTPSPYAELQAKAPGSKLSFVPGYDLDGKLVPSSALSAPDPAEGYPNWTLTPASATFAGQPGLLRQQITTAAVASGSQPVLVTEGAAPEQLDATIDSTLPANTGWRWSGTLTAPESPAGTNWQLKIFVKNQANAQLFTEGLSSSGGGSNRRINIGSYPNNVTGSLPSLSQTAKSHDLANSDLQQGTYSVTLTPGQKVHLDLRVVVGASAGQIQLRWVPPDNQAASIAEAVAAAQAANQAVIFAYDEGTEGSDRGGSNQAAGMVLPGYQEALIAAVAAAQPNTVVVLNNGAPILMPWAAGVKSILQMWYPGQAGGPATANVLLGNVNPSGKLPVTFPKDGTSFPTYDPNCTNTAANGNCPIYPGVAQMGFLGQTPHGYREIWGLDKDLGNGIFQGYRWYDKYGVTPMYPFGHGLSYTTFAYSNLARTPRGDGTVDVAVDVKNSGDVRGDEVVLAYVSDGPAVAGVQQAERSLRGFERVALDAGQTKRVSFKLERRSFEYWDSAKDEWVYNAGPRTISVGGLTTNVWAASTEVQQTAGGTVPATLSLLLGTVTDLGPFQAGVGQDYLATIGATVTSTAGEATLSVADPASTYTGRLVHSSGAFALAQPLLMRASTAAIAAGPWAGTGSAQTPQALLTYPGPVSSNAATIELKQSIAGNEPLRTGRYSKTLTFTLSTSTP